MTIQNVVMVHSVLLFFKIVRKSQRSIDCTTFSVPSLSKINCILMASTVEKYAVKILPSLEVR